MGRQPNYEIDAFIDKAINYEGDDCLIWPFLLNQDGYAHTGSHRLRNKYGSQVISRAVCIIVHGAPPTPKYDAARSKKCISRACINPKHLKWIIHEENVSSDVRGEDHYIIALTNDQVLEIRQLAGIKKPKDIAAQFGVGRGIIWKIMNNETCKWLEEPCDAELLFETTRPRMRDLFA